MTFTRIVRVFFGSISFFFFYFGEILLANIQVAKQILSPRPQMKPAILAIPIDVTSDIQVLALNNLITMTPGTLSLDVHPDRSTIYVHVMTAEDLKRAKNEIKSSIEKRILEMS